MELFGESIVSLVLIGVALLVVIRLFLKPIKWIFKLLLNTGLGFVLLFIVNFVGSWVNISLGINWINAIVVGIFGLPGAALLILVNWLAGL